MNRPPVWSEERLRADRSLAIDAFRRERMREPAAAYEAAFAESRVACESLLAASSDLLDLEGGAGGLVLDLLEPLRHVVGPPVSLDDLKTIADVTLSRARLRREPDVGRRVVEIVRAGLDRGRFPWVEQGRPPAGPERYAAIVATAALMATSRTGTRRRTEGRSNQEGEVRRALLAGRFAEVPVRPVATFSHAPEPGNFCGESVLGDRKADFIVRLRDTRIMPIECKVSNSAINSIKRLNNDSLVKAGHWRERMGNSNVVPAVVLGGVFHLHQLLRAQEGGLTIFWARDLATMMAWIEATNPC